MTAADRHLLIESDGALFALPGEAVTGVVEPVAVSPVPFVPDHVEGIVSLRGTVLPQIDLAMRLGRGRTADPSELVRVATAAGEVALRVSRVLQLISDVPRIEPDRSGEVGNSISGTIEWNGRDVPVLAPDMLAGLVAPTAEAAGPRAPLGIADEPDAEDATVLRVERLVVECAGHRYGLPPESVHEVVELETTMPLPGAPRHVLGLISLRGDLLPFLSLPGLLGFADVDRPPDSLVVLTHRGGCFAIAVEHLHGLLQLTEAAGAVPGLPTHTGAVLQDATGRLVADLDLDALIDADLGRFVATLSPLDGLTRRDRDTEPVAVTRLVTFVVGPRLYALPTERVERVLRGRPSEGVGWGRHRTVHGVIEERGRVIPSTDLRGLLDGDRGELGGSSGAILVVRAESDDVWAFTVDAVVDIVEVPTASVDRLVGTDNRMVAGVVHRDDGLVWLLSLEPFLGDVS